MKGNDDTIKQRLSADFGREIFVINEIDECPLPFNAGLDGWLEFLVLFEKDDLEKAEKQDREESPSYSPTSPSAAVPFDKRSISFPAKSPDFPPSSEGGAASQTDQRTPP